MSPKPMHLLLAAALAVPALAVPALREIQVFGGNDERAGTSLVFFGEAPLGLVGIQYGQPTWKVEYSDMLEEVKGKDLRLGMNNWTVLNTDVELTLGGARVAPGVYFLGLRCDDAGEFHLLAFEAGAAARKQLAPFMETLWGEPDVLVPLEHDVSSRRRDALTIALTSDGEAPERITLTIAWGPHALTATGIVHLAE